MNDDMHAVSLARLEEFSAKAEMLRTLLCAAFLDDAPRLEMSIFHGVQRLLHDWTSHISSVSLPSSTTIGSIHDLVERLYLQELFAALLLLSEESSLHGNTISVTAWPKLKASSEQDSEFYVSIHVRRYCAELLLYICFSRVCRTHYIVQALYPLLLEGNDDCRGVSQNHISQKSLFALPRFRQKKKFVSGLLNGVMLSTPDGVRGVLRVLLLNDRVEEGVTVDAAKHIASLFVSTMRHVWLLQQQQQEEFVVFYYEVLPLDVQVRLLSSQIVDLMTCHAEAVVMHEEKKTQHSFLQRQEELREAILIKPETLEERLHLCMATILNTALQLHSRREGKTAFNHHYKRYCLYNRHLLTPAFGALTLRSSTVDDNAKVPAALRRLLGLAKGSTLGPSPRALLLTLEPVSPGLLDLLSLMEKLPAACNEVLKSLLETLWWMEVQFEELAYIFLQGVFMSVRGSFVVDRVAAVVSVDIHSASSSVRRMTGLRNIVLGEKTPKEFVYKILQAAAAECKRRASSLTAGNRKCLKESTFLYTLEELEETEDKMSEEVMLVTLVETICVGLSAEEVFGAHATIDRVCDVLTTVATISIVCWRWAMLLIPRVFSGDMIHALLAECGTATERKRTVRMLLFQLERLSTVVETVGDDFADGDAGVVLATAATIVRQYECSWSGKDSSNKEDNKDASVLEFVDIVQAAEESLELNSVASLAVHLLSLSRTAEEFAFRSRNWDLCEKEKCKTADVISAMWMCVRVLTEVNDACAAAAAGKAMMWWSLARADSMDSSFIAWLFVELLGIDENKPSTFYAIVPCATGPVSPPKIAQLKVRLLDVLLGLCDYDAEGRTLRNVDDYCKVERKSTLYDVLTGLCGPQNGSVVQVAALHLVGPFVVATYPRVSLSSACRLCVDVFRHSKYEMAKAACASMFSYVAESFAEIGDIVALSDMDIAQLRDTADALQHYRSPPGGDLIHEEVIRRHGHFIMDMLQHQCHRVLALVQEV